MNTDQVLE